MSDLFTSLGGLGQALVARLGSLNVWTAALFGGALVLDRALARRARASLRIALYAPVALRVLLPEGWGFSPFAGASVSAFFAPLARIGAVAPAEGSEASHGSMFALAAVAYFAVAALLAARAWLARVRLGRSLAGARVLPGPHPGIARPVVEHEELGPMVVGLLSPRVVIPSRLLASGEERSLDCVLRHERAHLRRGDAWLSAGVQLLAVAAWPVLPVWLAAARVRQLIELACDEEALHGADHAARRQYGHALLDMAEWRSLAVVPAGAGALHFGSTLRTRIEALASQRHWPWPLQALALLAGTSFLAVACGSTATPTSSTASAASAEDHEGYGYEFSKDSSKAAPGANGPFSSGPGGRVPPEAIQHEVRLHFDTFRACYEAGLKRDPKLAGTVIVKYAFDEHGKTYDVADGNSTMPDKQVVSCVMDGFRTITYPPAEAGEVTVVYPLEFSPD
ncbi:MAG TPA: M56 family metallopeptidase [Polyangiaceae bacterium]